MQWGLFSKKGLRSLDESTARLNIWHGAVRSSKSINSAVRWLEFVKTAPPGDLLMVGKTERTLKRNILGPIEEIVGSKRFQHVQGQGEVYILGRKIYTAGANDERSAGKIRGMTLAGAYGDELTLWPASFWSELLNRMSVRGAKFFGTTNPDSPFHWLKTGYLDRTDLNLRQWHFELADNPNLDPEYIESLKREHSASKLVYQRMVLGLWVLAEGVIYDGLDLDIHGFDDDQAPKQFDALRIVVDYGTQNPFHALLIGVRDGVSYVLDEWRYCGRDTGRQLTNGQYVDALLKWRPDAQSLEVIVDPSASSFKAELAARGFFNVTDADNDVKEGILTVSNRLTKGLLRIHRTRCPELVKEMGTYAWDPKASLRGDDQPLKINDHGPDALRYHEFTLFGDVSGLAALEALSAW